MPPEQVDLAELRLGGGPHGDIVGEEHVDPAGVDAHVERRLAERELDGAQVEDELADPELVLAAEVVHARRRERALVDPVAEMYVEGREEPRHEDDEQDDERDDDDPEPA